MSTSALSQKSLDEDGFLKQMSGWTRDAAHELAERNNLGPLNEKHWKIIDFVREYYRKHGEGPPIVTIGRSLKMAPREICTLFPCGIARGAYRLAGLPRPRGCV